MHVNYDYDYDYEPHQPYEPMHCQQMKPDTECGVPLCIASY